jgi:DNA-binding CsgD family transcriptional regulator
MPLSTWHECSATIQCIYDAGLEFDKWPTVLERIADHLGASVACLVRHDLARGAGAMLMVRTDPSFARLYSEHYAKINVFAQRARNQPPQTCVTDRMYMPKEELFRTEFYDGFMRPQAVHTLLNVYLLAERECGTRIAFARSPRHGEWEQEHLDTLRLFAPHVHRAALLNRELAATRLRESGALASLSGLSQAVFLVEAGGRLRFANQAAERMIAGGDGLTLERQCLVAHDRRETARLHRIVGEAADGGPAESSDCTLVVTRPSGRSPYRLVVAPMPAADAWFLTPSPMAIVITCDPDDAVVISIAAVSRRYGLTHAETVVLSEIARGSGLAPAAAAVGVSLSTARTHLQRVFEKTGTRRQAELVRLIADYALTATSLSAERPHVPAPEEAGSSFGLLSTGVALRTH